MTRERTGAVARSRRLYGRVRIVLAAIGAVGGAVPAAACDVSVGWHPWEPYAFRAADGRLDGFEVRLIDALLPRIGCRPEWRERPWARIVREIEEGRLGMAPWAADTAERRRFAWFTRAYIAEPAGLFALEPGRAAAMTIASFADLAASGLRLGAQIGAAYSEEYEALRIGGAFGDRLTLVTDEERLVTLLAAGRVDVIVNTPISMRHMLAKAGIAQDRLRAPWPRLGDGRAYLMMGRRSVPEALAARIDAALGDMLADGSYDAILRDYDPTLSLRPPDPTAKATP